jgi:hypothetical protein
MYEIFLNESRLILIILMWLTKDLMIDYKCLISLFSPSNVDIIDSYFICHSWMYITSHYVDYMKNI